jgi:DNA recombination protein RmuC
VFELGRELYERLSTMGEHLSRVGRSLTSAVDAYNRGVGSFENRVLTTARKLRDLHVTQAEITAMETIEASVRPLTAPELLPLDETDTDTTRRWVTNPPVDRTTRDTPPPLPGFDTRTG